MIYFIAAVYNEQYELGDLIAHVSGIGLDGFRIVDDGSTDATPDILQFYSKKLKDFQYKTISHTGLPETVKNEAKNMVPDGSWCVMLDADERFTVDTIERIYNLFHEDQQGTIEQYDYIYFAQNEIIDGYHVRTFQKCKLFRKEAITFPLENIHADDQFEGKGEYFGWTVEHRKSSVKQIQREKEYLETYKRLLDEGKIDEGRYRWLVGLHHFVK